MELQNSSISNFRRFLIKVMIPLILLMVVTGLIFNYFFEQKIIFASEISGAYKLNRIINKTYPDEIPILGSSRAEGGYIPDSLGSSYFNYGISGAKYDVTLFFLNKECRKKKNNPYIIINIDLDGLYPGYGDIANYLPFAYDPDIRHILGKNYNGTYSIPFIKYFGKYETYLRYYLNDKLNLTKYVNKGATLDKNVLSEKKFKELVDSRLGTPSNFDIYPPIKDGLLKIIKEHPKQYFIFVIAPYHMSYFNMYGNAEEEKSFLNEIIMQPNAKVLDFSRIILPDSFFQNTTHLNYKGAIVFDRILKDSLAIIYNKTSK